MTKNKPKARDTRIFVIVMLCFAVLHVSPVLAQTDSSASQDQWQFSGAIYLWGADMGGHTNRGSEVEVGFSDLVDNLEMAFMGAFAARKNNWSLLIDVIYLDLGVENTTELSIPIGDNLLPVTTTTDLDVKSWVMHFAGGYGLYSEGKSRLDLIGGARYLDLSMDLFLELQSLGPGQSRTISESLTDGFCRTTLMSVPANRILLGRQLRELDTGLARCGTWHSCTGTLNGILIRPG